MSRERTLGSVVLFVLLVALFIVPEIFYRSGQLAVVAVGEIQQNERKDLFTKMFELSRSDQLNLTSDYSFWDDMIAFADGSLSDEWGTDNLSSGIQTFGVSGIWVVDRHDAVRFGLRSGPDGEYVRDDVLPLPLDVIKEATGRKPVAEFFWNIGGVVHTVMAAGIVPTADSERATPPQGYFVTIKPVDDRLLSQLGQWTGTEIKLMPADTPEEPNGLIDANWGTYVFWHPLEDHAGSRVALLRLERDSPVVAVLFRQVKRDRVLAYAATAAVAFLLIVVLLQMNRARLRAEGIAHDMTQKLQQTNEELAKRVHERTEELEKDIAQRIQTEQELRTRTEELERMNKVMVGRELRMEEMKRELKEKEQAQ